MKKLIVASIIAVSALFANAVSVDWLLTCGNMKDHSGNAFSGKYELYATGGDLTTPLLAYANDSAGATFNKQAFTVASGMTVGTSYDFYYVITDSGNYTFTSSTITGYQALGTGATTVAFGNQASATSGGTWTPAGPEPVPEPTSGMLLMLGVGLMALKRKAKKA